MSKQTGSKLLSILLGPALFFLVGVALQGSFGREPAYAIGAAAWIIAWWITRPVHIAVTALLPVGINAIFQIAPMAPVISQYSSATVILLFGASLICMPWNSTGLGNRLALGSLRAVGTSVKRQIAVWFLVAVTLTTVLPASVVCTLLTPIAVSMLKFLGHEDISTSKFAPSILLAVAWGSCVGGALTPLGGAMNLTAITYLEEFTGQELLYIDWILHMAPFVVVMVAVVLGVMLFFPTGITKIEGTKEYFAEAYAKLGKMSRSEKICASIFVLALVLSLFRPVYQTLLPGLTPTYVFFILGLLMFFIKGDDKKPLIAWPYAEKNMMWSMLFLFAGGLALGQLITQTGAAVKIAEVLTSMSLTGGIFTIFVFVFLTCFVAEVSSQTASAAIVVPIVLSTTTSLGLNPAPFIFITVMAFNTSYVLPLGVRAIPVGHGMDVNVLMKRGIVVAAINTCVITVVGFIFMQVWPYFSSLPGIN